MTRTFFTVVTFLVGTDFLELGKIYGRWRGIGLRRMVFGLWPQVFGA
jgi:hypothetical protein